jgi:aspartyl-tRNA(Asn)/glutamyl-tRNA(Gln) amidotransferase subunit A
MDATRMTLSELQGILRARELSAQELLALHLEQIQAVDGDVKAYLRLTESLAAEQARAADRALRVGEAGALAGIPMVVKDVLCVRGVETTAGSQILRGFKPPYTGTAVKRLFDAGAVMLGVSNCDEFAMGSSTENSGYFPTHNPWDLNRVPGGSSGGSAAAVAAGEAVFGIGTDTGGSIRQPAALCGVIGMKPTYGRVSRYGLIAFASSLDQIGPFTRSVEDCALVLETMGGHDPLDATSADRPNDVRRDLEAGIKGMRLGVPKEYFDVEGMEPGVKAHVDTALQLLQSAGAELVDVSLPHTDYGLASYYIIAPAECSSNLARFDAVRYGLRVGDDGVNSLEDVMSLTREAGFGPEVKRRIIIGTYALSSGYYDAYYGQAQKVRTLIARDFAAAFENADVLVSPTSPFVAFGIGERIADPMAMYVNDLCTLPASLAGTPAISVPCGLSDGLPVGLQIMAPALADERCYRVGAAFEAAVAGSASGPVLASIPELSR